MKFKNNYSLADYAYVILEQREDPLLCRFCCYFSGQAVNFYKRVTCYDRDQGNRGPFRCEELYKLIYKKEFKHQWTSIHLNNHLILNFCFK